MKHPLPPFWSNTLSSTLGTVIGIVLTLGTTLALQRHEQKVTERTAALMVIHNLDMFCNGVEAQITALEAADTLINYVFTHDHIDRISEDTLVLFIKKLTIPDFIVDDNTAENIFSTNVETWKNVENREFIEWTGRCFSIKNEIKKTQERIEEDKQQMQDIYLRLLDDTDAPVETVREMVERMLATPDICCYIRKRATYLSGLKMELSLLQQFNQSNKKMMHIKDHEMKGSFQQLEYKDYHSDSIK